MPDEFRSVRCWRISFWEMDNSLKSTVLLYIGDVNNVCNTLILGADLLGVKMNICAPDEYRVRQEIWDIKKQETV